MTLLSLITHQPRHFSHQPHPPPKPVFTACIIYFYLHYIPTYYVLHINLTPPKETEPYNLEGKESALHFCYLIAWATVQKLLFTKLQEDFSPMSLNSQ